MGDATPGTPSTRDGEAVGGPLGARTTIDKRLLAASAALIGLLLTLAVNVARLHPGFGEDRHGIGVLTVDDWQEGQLATAAAMVLIFIAAVLVARMRRYASRRNLLLFAALLVLAFDHLVSALLTTGFDSLSANRFPTWAAAGNGVLGALLLVGAALLPDRPVVRWVRATRWIIVGCGAGLSAVFLAVWLLVDHLPRAFDSLPANPEDLQLLSEHPALFAVELVTAACYAMTGVRFVGIGTTEDDVLSQWFGVGSIVAAVAYLNFALFPAQFTELLYLGDLFFLIAVAAWLYGAVREIATAEAAQAHRAVFTERRRIARDLHDGVAQELAYMESQIHAAMRREDAGPEQWGRVLRTVERALAESRGAINALNRPVDESLADAVHHTAREAADRGGARLRLDLDPKVDVSPDERVALLQITREAVGNAVRHGSARSISIELWNSAGTHLRISDDGDGFDLDSAPNRGFGLTSMSERAESLGGQFSIISSPGRGAVVEVEVP